MKQLFNISFFILALCLVSFAFSEPPIKNNVKERIYKMKAVFVFNFTKYIEWPENDSNKSFVIAILGESHIIEPLNIIASKKNIGNQKIIVNKFKNIDDVKKANILFVDSTFNMNLEKLLKKIESDNILLIGDKAGLAKKGYGLSFFIEDGKVRFEMNRDVIKNANLSVSSQLLKIAKIIE